MTEVLPVNDANGAVLDVVFLHGLDGDAWLTWSYDRQPNSFWPRWLAEDVEDVAVWTVNYDAWASGYLGRSMPIKDRALNIMDQMQNRGIGERPLCFVAHSMGGLLVKEMLMHSVRSRGDFRAFADQTRGVSFLATPHTGSSLATALDAFRRLARATAAVEDLKREQQLLRHLSDDYRDWVTESEIRNQVYYESHPTKGVLVVQPSSANPGLPDVRPIPIDADHSRICKPANRDAQVYLGVKKFVGSLVTEVTRPPPANLPAFVPHPIHGRGEILSRLQTALARPGSVLAELSGVAGIGKTAIATQLAREVAKDAHAVYLSARGFPGVTVGSVLVSLAASVADYRERSRLADLLLKPDLTDLAKLDEVLDRLGGDRMLIVVDDAERLRDDSGKPRDQTLENLFEAITRRPGHHVQILFVTADPFLKSTLAHEEVEHGLPAAPFGKFLASLEAGRSVGLGKMPADELRNSLDGHPRVAELIYGIKSESDQPVRYLASIARDSEELGGALLNSVDDVERAALRALAGIGRPALPAAVGHLIGVPEEVVHVALGRLCARRIVRRRNGRFDLPAADAHRLAGRITPADAADLRRRAAAYFEPSSGDPAPRRLDDLSDAFDAIDLHIQAGNHQRALRLIHDLDRDHLKEWGHTSALTSSLTRLTGHLTDPYDRVKHASLLARAFAHSGDVGAAIAMTQAALDLNDALEITDVQLALLVQMAGYLYDADLVRYAAARYESALGLAGDGHPMAAEAQLGLALCHTETGDFDAASGALDTAETHLGRQPPTKDNGKLVRARILFGRACVAAELGELRCCRDLLGSAQETAEQAGGKMLAARCKDLRARAEWQRGDLDRALKEAQDAHREAARIGNPDLNRAASVTLATMHLRHRDPETALKVATTATRFARSPLVAEAFALRGLALVRLAAIDPAVEAFTSAGERSQELLGSEPARYMMRDVQALALAGLALIKPGTSEMPAVLAYRKAIGGSRNARGAWHRRRELFRALVSERPDDALPLLRDLLE